MSGSDYLSDPTVIVSLTNAVVFFLLLAMAVVKFAKLKHFSTDNNSKYSKLFYIY